MTNRTSTHVTFGSAWSNKMKQGFETSIHTYCANINKSTKKLITFKSQCLFFSYLQPLTSSAWDTMA